MCFSVVIALKVLCLETVVALPVARRYYPTERISDSYVAVALSYIFVHTECTGICIAIWSHMLCVLFFVIISLMKKSRRLTTQGHRFFALLEFSSVNMRFVVDGIALLRTTKDNSTRMLDQYRLIYIHFSDNKLT